MTSKAEIGIIGGSGLYHLLDDATDLDVSTPYGAPSARPTLGVMAGRGVAFLPRHGVDHEIPPHRVNWKANIWALRELGVRRVLAPCAAGSLRPGICPGDVVVCDQLVDRTSGRADTFFDGPELVHLAFADPYCPELRSVAASAGATAGLRVHPTGTVVVIQGPRFSTRAESSWFRDQGWDLVNMTQYPEAALARELGLCYAGIAQVTDHDTGLEGDVDVRPVTAASAFDVLSQMARPLRNLLEASVAAMPLGTSCDCGAAAT